MSYACAHACGQINNYKLCVLFVTAVCVLSPIELRWTMKRYNFFLSLFDQRSPSQPSFGMSRNAPRKRCVTSRLPAAKETMISLAFPHLYFKMLVTDHLPGSGASFLFCVPSPCQHFALSRRAYFFCRRTKQWLLIGSRCHNACHRREDKISTRVDEAD